MKKCNFTLSDIAVKLLLSGLPIILFYLVYIIFAMRSHTNTSADALVHIYAPQLEHILMSLTLLIAGSLLLDITAKELKKE